jgi:Family of unknown function (DUF5931)
VPLWRPLAVFRFAALGYAALLIVLDFRRYAHPVAGWAVIAVIAVWTVATSYGYARPRRRGIELANVDIICGWIFSVLLVIWCGFFAFVITGGISSSR